MNSEKKRIPYGSEKDCIFFDDEKCGDCGVKWGELHKEGCDQEQCPLCGGQYISCGCDQAANKINSEGANVMKENKQKFFETGCAKCKAEYMEQYRQFCRENCAVCAGQFVICGCSLKARVVDFPVSKQDEPALKPALQVIFLKGYFKQGYIDALKSAVLEVENGILAEFEADHRG